jgi:phytoene synthase
MPLDPSLAALREALAPPARLALAYAPADTRRTWLAALALDARLAQVVRAARDPLIGQIRLAWWRERLGEPASAWPKGEPLLALLREWDGAHGALSSAVDGWEVLLGEAPLPKPDLLVAAEGRASALVAAAGRLGEEAHGQAVLELGRSWALSDFAANMPEPREQTALAELRAEHDVRPMRLPRALRPVVVLDGMARSGGSGAGALLRGIRLGIFGG